MTMKHFRIFLYFWFILIFSLPAAAFDFQKGVHGIPWGSAISEYDYLTEVHKSGDAAYYANSNMLYRVANELVPAVYYGFYKDQFFAVFIKLGSPYQFLHLNQQFTAKYGNPKSTFSTAKQQKILRWKNADVKIKLKMKEASGDYKLALYYAPLSTKLNEEHLERTAAEASSPTPAQKDETKKSAPLLDE
jgi:hypothetical protein